MSTRSPDVPGTGPKIALVVDLDGTLCRTDTLHEGILALATASPSALFKLPGWLSQGRAGLKAEIADRIIINPDDLPLNESVLDALRAARAEGRHTALVSAADHRQVTAIAEAFGLFDEAYGTAEGRNLKGEEKAAFLVEHFGLRRFDYIGDSRADLAIWKVANKAVTVGANKSMRAAAEASNPEVEHLDPPEGKVSAMLRAIRTYQWSKNVLMFVPALAAHDLSRLWPVALGFIAFSLTASAVYVINDLLDLAADRAHPRKRKRPFASGELSAATGAVMVAILLGLALLFGLATGNPLFLAVLSVYLVATFAYSFSLKRKLIVDVLTLAGLYTVRIVAGAAAATVILSPWLLGFSMFLFLALAAVKRQAELTDQMQSGRASSGRAYDPEDLPILRGIAISSGHAAVLVMALYISSDTVQTLYGTPQMLWLIAPLLLYWVLRMIMATHRGKMTDDPIIYAAKDKVSLLVVAGCVAIAVVATF